MIKFVLHDTLLCISCVNASNICDIFWFREIKLFEIEIKLKCLFWIAITIIKLHDNRLCLYREYVFYCHEYLFF